MEENKEQRTEAAPAEVTQNEEDARGRESVNYEELESFINAWFLNIRNLVRVTKEKDSNLYKMNNELQSYRNGYSRQLFKSMAQYLINFREDCAKSLRDAEAYEIKKEDLVKYIGYVSQDYETLLENIGIEVTENGITYNGTSVNSLPSQTKVFEMEAQDAAPIGNVAEERQSVPLSSLQQITEYFAAKTDEIISLLKDNSAIDKVVAEYIKQSALIERNEQQIVLYPVVRKLVEYGGELKWRTKEIAAEADSLEASTLLVAYKDVLSLVINGTESILALCCVTVENALSAGDVYDPKKHRIMKFIPLSSDRADENGKIVKVYTDLYIMEDKVLYPAKVDVKKVQ